MAIVLSATWIAKEGSEETVREALEHLAPASRTEEGNIYYQAYQDPAEPRVFRIFEVYKDDAAVKAHTEYEHFTQWAAGQAIPALEERKRDFYETLDY
ncbi:quinol monooxygenase YgiN [Homoserinimonas aerilata]|uniref:Quinol monooxygenase YgiN n=1 Tax=Homoserinimonas aerilata TaxID=1162970 RepID=A0A542YKE7_9MICO|nr:putative quinol monooxygenase [Homoserinimonas aerilata]TQL48414.1 quinol monooxygenase YgiN [Homoserinimonas aerilata]